MTRPGVKVIASPVPDYPHTIDDNGRTATVWCVYCEVPMTVPVDKLDRGPFKCCGCGSKSFRRKRHGR